MNKEQSSIPGEQIVEEPNGTETLGKQYEQKEVDNILNSAKQRLIDKHSKELENFVKKSDYETLNNELKTFKLKQEFVNRFGGKEEAFDLFIEKNKELINDPEPIEKLRAIKSQYSYMFKTDTTEIRNDEKVEEEFIQGTNIRKYVSRK